MGNASLAVAVALAAVFGAAVLWAAVYYTHRYIHQECLKLAHWFHVLVRPAPGDYGRERAPARQDAPDEAARERARRKAEREEQEKRRKEKVRRRVQEWEDSEGTYVTPGYTAPQRQRRYGDADAEYALAGRAGRVLMQPCVPVFMPLGQPYVREYIPLAARPAPRLGSPPGIPMERVPAYPQPAYRPTPAQSYVGKRAGPSVEYAGEEVEGESQRSAGAAQWKNDFIHICDEYPPIVREALEREEKEKKEEAKAKQVPDESSDDGSDSVEEVPRANIPTATQRPAFHFPQNPYSPSRTWNPAPTSYPRQW